MLRLGGVLLISLAIVACTDDEAADLRIQLAVQGTQIAAMQAAGDATATVLALPSETVAPTATVPTTTPTAMPPTPTPTPVPPTPTVPSPTSTILPAVATLLALPTATLMPPQQVVALFFEWIEPELAEIETLVRQLDRDVARADTENQRTHIFTEFFKAIAGHKITFVKSFSDQEGKRDVCRNAAAFYPRVFASRFGAGVQCQQDQGYYKRSLLDIHDDLESYSLWMQTYHGMRNLNVLTSESEDFYRISRADPARRAAETRISNVREFSASDRALLLDFVRQDRQRAAGDQRR
ncbi:MAG: hypothetical protein CL878_07180 [Dehalococcoidia bacterium]|nr:hypothetical protein [Dehalococcoidia bacterium]